MNDRYQQTLNYMLSKLPMFHRQGAAAYKADLTNIIALCEALGNPHQRIKTIHVAGTNGKGSTSHMLAAVLHQAGYRTGLYTSPHLKDFRERIRINGEMIGEENVIAFVEEHKALFDRIKPSFFEMTLALTFDFFAKQKVEIAVIETGLGGRLDSTNIIQPALSVITNISLDHTAILGNTLEAIAREKAGIIKKQTPVVIGQHQTEVEEVFIRQANALQAPLTFASLMWDIDEVRYLSDRLSVDIKRKEGDVHYHKLQLDLCGNYQLKNIKTVLETVVQLNELGYKLEKTDVYQGLSNVQGLTGLQGRWMMIQQKPLIICDTGHNVDGITQVVEQLKHMPHKHLRIVFGMVQDKDITEVLALLPKQARYYFCKADLPRAMEAHELQTKASVYQLIGETYSSVIAAFDAAKAEAADDDLIYVGGSTFVVAEIL